MVKKKLKEVCIVAWASEGSPGTNKELARLYRKDVDAKVILEMIEELKAKLK